MWSRDKFLLFGLLLWYLALSVWTAQSPTDPQFWLISSLLPAAFVVGLIATHRRFPLSHPSSGLRTPPLLWTALDLAGHRAGESKGLAP
jgi:uncharacterized membrane protein YjdF